MTTPKPLAEQVAADRARLDGLLGDERKSCMTRHAQLLLDAAYARIDELERKVDEAGGREAGAQATARQLAGIVVRWAAWLQGRCGTCGGSGCVPDSPGPDASPEPCPACEELREETCALAERHRRNGATP